MNIFPYRIFPILLLFIFMGCTATSQSITKITYNSGGGEMGGYLNAQLTKDSIIVGITKPYIKQIVIRDKIHRDLWDSLTKPVTMKDFREIKSGESVIHIDGIDVTLKVETEQETYSFVNGNIDGIKNKTVFHFMKILEDTLGKIYINEKYE